jgi:hypothetical protein
MQEVLTAIQVTQNWNPSYSYSKLPEGYTMSTMPAHWKTMLMPVEPAEKGIPQLSNVTIENVVVHSASRALFVEGLPQAHATNFTLRNVSINAKAAGSIAYATNWKFKNLQLKANDGKPVKLLHTDGVEL